MLRFAIFFSNGSMDIVFASNTDEARRKVIEVCAQDDVKITSVVQL